MTATLPTEAWVAAIVALPDMGPNRFRALMMSLGTAEEAWRAVVAGAVHRLPAVAATLGREPERVAEAWCRAAAELEPEGYWQRHLDAGVGVLLAGGPSYPEVFAADPCPPPLLFHHGDPDALAGPRVGIVGTRDCTRYGYDVAFELGRDLTAAGVSVVSGLALGIDAAAHAGAVEAAAGEAGEAGPIAVVGSGLDVVYPRRNGPLWREVVRRGVALSEYPLGAPAAAWHFPARNRLIAALADVLVVVESHARGGALLTVEEALARDRTVMAVPGSVRSPASTGTNQLLAEGPGPTVARDAADVLVALGLAPGSRRATTERRPAPTPEDQAVLDALGWQPATLEHLLVRTGVPLPALAGALGRLEADGWLAQRAGWFERRAKVDG